MMFKHKLSQLFRNIFNSILTPKKYVQLARIYGGLVLFLKLNISDYIRIRRIKKANDRHFEKFSIHGYSYPVYIRAGTTDVGVLEDILIRESYSFYRPNKSPSLIIDAGANIGLSCIYFANRYRGAQIIALEPDYDNYQLGILNTKPYKEQIKLLNAALWYKNMKLSL